MKSVRKVRQASIDLTLRALRNLCFFAFKNRFPIPDMIFLNRKGAKGIMNEICTQSSPREY
jgi:hypothetical protein